ncbi:MAG TPA: pyridoxamine 5'-phosphate oxidase [Pyrinomonadaceae bacterium]|jgi:pyridoxamine 5'-phosphate oxidase|nr:pyridoxamine 5'-phosphate oxidase [Pyrinomonadaceae bacterium]
MTTDTTTLETLDEKLVERDPIKQFQLWFDEAVAAKLPLAEAMTLATATPEGRPSARMVLLKQVDEDGFVFFTNYHSAKASQLESNPYAALVFYWNPLDRQVRIEGRVERTSAEESESYFQTRPRESQIGAWASPQSSVIAGREVLEERARELEAYYRDRAIECPGHWGGYRLRPDKIEFWKSRIGRLHDRILYELTSDGTWSINRLAP